MSITFKTGGSLCALARRLKGLPRRYAHAISCAIWLTRDDLAIVACVVTAAALEYGYLSHHLDAVDAFSRLWIIWFAIAQWLDGRWWQRVNLPVSGLYQEAKRGTLRLTGMALMIERAAFVLFGAMVVSWLIVHHWQ
jgi:hypothetical protein